MEPVNSFSVGERVSHPKFGLGTVTSVEPEVVEVRFETAGLKRLSIKHAVLLKPDKALEDALTPGGEAYQSWIDGTFVFEGEEAEHSLGSHWSPFFNEPTDILGRLPEILSKSLVQVAYADNHPPLRPVPADWPKGFSLVWPLRVSGLATVLHATKEANYLVSVYPFACEGTQHQLKLNKVHVWKSGLEAHIECDFGPTSVTFFDTLYGANRGWYESGKTYQFVLTGIAYHCRRAEDQVLLAWNPKQSERFRELAPELAADLPDTETMPVHTKGMAVFFPIHEWDRDDYTFRGPIKSVKEVEILEQPGWKARVTVLRDIDNDDRELDLDIIVTRKVWGDAPPPQVGEDMEGSLWLQGYLWWVGAMA
ncbi:DUF3553 domain-containing protein [Geobacter sulfurreducens]|uniref:DUF3553 domain-containing protein n=1 Tax=Geobacter sulfurreducens TaxID=35554 RepID=UPI0020B7D649|nr:DUF3553 domain-containing protein [Geobacter sulfurreducens]UTG93172.1 hypothetical protein J8622_02235 [Geobacter sulfurreducens]